MDIFLQYNADLALTSVSSKKNDQKGQQTLTHLMILEVVTESGLAYWTVYKLHFLYFYMY